MSGNKYRVRNWKEYNKSLVQRGSLTLWIDEEMLEKWGTSVKTGKKGRPEAYPDEVISCALHLKAVLHLKLRSLEGFLISIMQLLKLDLKVPHYSTICKRQKNLKIVLAKTLQAKEGLHLVIDSTGLKVFGEGEWKVRGHGTVTKRLWRKLHLAINAKTHMIEASELTDLGTQDCEGFAQLLDSIEDPIEKVIGDGAYDRFSCYEVMEKRGGIGIFPPQRNAVTSQERSRNKKKASPEAIKKRDEAVESIRSLGREEWKIQTGYHRRSLAETGMFRIKTVLGRNLSCHSFENQEVESQVWCSVLNTLTLLGMPQTSPL